MIVFWILAGLATALAALLVLTGARRGAGTAAAKEPDVAGRELDELDRLKARGLLTQDAWIAARAEAGRRLLATRVNPVALATGPNDRRWVLTGLGLAGAVALAVYLSVGTPGLADQTYEQRVNTWATSPRTLEPVQAAAVMARAVRERPGDRQALRLLGAARFEAGDAIGAASAFRRALVLDGEDAQSWARLGESLVRAQDGVVGADAEFAFREAIRRDPGQLGARYFLGEAALARGDAAGVQAAWTPLIEALDRADPRRADLERRLAGATG